jgi:hypothetical protein
MLNLKREGTIAELRRKRIGEVLLVTSRLH